MKSEFVKGKDNHQLEAVLVQIRRRCQHQDWKITADGDNTAITVTIEMSEPSEAAKPVEAEPAYSTPEEFERVREASKAASQPEPKPSKKK